MRVAAVIPAFNEADMVGAVVRSARPYVETVVVIDDGSTDTTAEAARAAGATTLVHGVNKGKGAALRTGFSWALDAGVDAVITLDADGQHRPEEIARFLEAAQREPSVEVWVGNRMAHRAGMPLIRWWTNRLLSGLLSAVMGVRVPDTQNGFRLYRRRAVERMPVAESGFAAESAALMALADRGIRIGVVPVSTVYGTEHSKIRPWRDTVDFIRMLSRYAGKMSDAAEKKRTCEHS